MNERPLKIMHTLKDIPALISLVCVVVALFLAHRNDVGQEIVPGHLEEVSSILWSGNTNAFYPHLNHPQKVEKDDLLGWTLDSSQYHATQSLLRFAQVGDVDEAAMEALGLTLGMEDPINLFSLPANNNKSSRPQNIINTSPTLDEIRILESILDSLRRAYNQSGVKTRDENLLQAIQKTESNLNSLKNQKERAILASESPENDRKPKGHNWNLMYIKSFADSLLRVNQVVASEPGLFNGIQTQEGRFTYHLIQKDSHWVRFIPSTSESPIMRHFDDNQVKLRGPDQPGSISILEVKKQDNTWLLKLPDLSDIPEFTGSWTILSNKEYTLLEEWVTWKR